MRGWRSCRAFVGSFGDSFIRSFIHSFVHSFIHSFVHSFIHSFVRSFDHSIVHSFIHLRHPHDTDTPTPKPTPTPTPTPTHPRPRTRDPEPEPEPKPEPCAGEPAAAHRVHVPCDRGHPSALRVVAHLLAPQRGAQADQLTARGPALPRRLQGQACCWLGFGGFPGPDSDPQPYRPP